MADRRPILSALFAAAMVAAASLPAAADEEAAWTALKRPGTAIIMRHAVAPGTGDPPDMVLGDCETQRTLDDEGRAQARRIGDILKANGLEFDRVLTSEWCRARETAELLDVGPVEPMPALNSFFRNPEVKDAVTDEVRALLADAGEERLLLVTHQVNITALTDHYPKSGEIVVVEVGGDGALSVVATADISPPPRD
ncbi:histidine phosphatase family protein [Acuticoccus sp. M5D2P5]|uniref:histidine phosphatase family protein n=1 Tax=Acuticoccus kalidii TaxID=2910977 RepID=UPI001F1BE1B5|nr:histidine phosphatase family protein [Acuticoccus kalidii]MCF3933582.1 histidine phosphatase family protein [Acuticoccus kalidii]